MGDYPVGKDQLLIQRRKHRRGNDRGKEKHKSENFISVYLLIKEVRENERQRRYDNKTQKEKNKRVFQSLVYDGRRGGEFLEQPLKIIE